MIRLCDLGSPFAALSLHSLQGWNDSFPHHLHANISVEAKDLNQIRQISELLVRYLR